MRALWQRQSTLEKLEYTLEKAIRAGGEDSVEGRTLFDSFSSLPAKAPG